MKNKLIFTLIHFIHPLLFLQKHWQVMKDDAGRFKYWSVFVGVTN